MAIDYKNTLNLPRTDFAMRADLVKREPERLAKWESDDLYGKIQAARAGAEKFILHDGPPFANGDVHIGTALNKILKDIILKYQTLRGKAAPYVPGWDCHGLPIEFKVSQEMRKEGNTDADAATIRTACDAYARKFIDLQRTQFKRLGVLGEWEKPYLTLDKSYEAEELRLFANIVEKGFVYRGKKPVYWSIPARTALAEAEVEYKDHVSNSIFVKFPVVGQPGVSIVIWTTTPWTLPANLAVAYNSRFTYTMVRVGEECLIVSTMLLDQVAATAGWGGFEIIRTIRADELAQLEYQHPFCNRTGKLYAGDFFVTNDTGSGFVHIAPGHGQEDYQVGLVNGLPIYSPVDDEGRLAHTNDLPFEQQMGAELLGKAILEKNGKSEANEAVLEVLREKNALIHREDYTHSYPHCWRSKTPVIFRAMDQWFVRIDHEQDGKTFRQQAIAEIDMVSWIPDWGIKRIRGAVESRPDWCISRQRTWGVPIPAFYDADNNPILDPRVIRKVADVVAEHGSNIWFEQNAKNLWKMVRPDNWSGPEAHTKSTDTLDVWIDSGSSSRAVTAVRDELWPPGTEKPFQADMYLEGSDQHRGWFQSSLLLSLAGNGAAPYKTVLTHGFMVDADKEKISKSKQGSYEKPQTAEAYVKNYGADVVRLWVASQDFRNDIIVSDERIKTVGETYRGLRNAMRYQLSNLYDFDPAKNTVPDADLTSLDRWILWKFSEVEKEVVTAYDKFEFHIVYQTLSQFVAVELSAMYHDWIKDRLYTDPAGSQRRRSTQTTLYRLVTSLCRMLSPILVFTTDEAWEFVPLEAASSVHLCSWSPNPFPFSEKERQTWNLLLQRRELELTGLEAARREKVIGKALEAKIVISGSRSFLATEIEHQDTLREILNVSQVEFVTEGISADLSHSVVTQADGEKCARCWHSETDIGKNTEHPTICGRCVEAVSTINAA
jgi:isoleucyl-tRNA synthetase